MERGAAVLSEAEEEEEDKILDETEAVLPPLKQYDLTIVPQKPGGSGIPDGCCGSVRQGDMYIRCGKGGDPLLGGIRGLLCKSHATQWNMARARITECYDHHSLSLRKPPKSKPFPLQVGVDMRYIMADVFATADTAKKAISPSPKVLADFATHLSTIISNTDAAATLQRMGDIAAAAESVAQSQAVRVLADAKRLSELHNSKTAFNLHRGFLSIEAAKSPVMASKRLRDVGSDSVEELKRQRSELTDVSRRLEDMEAELADVRKWRTTASLLIKDFVHCALPLLGHPEAVNLTEALAKLQMVDEHALAKQRLTEIEAMMKATGMQS